MSNQEQTLEERFDMKFPVSIDYVQLNEIEKGSTGVLATVENDRRHKRALLIRNETLDFIKKELAQALQQRDKEIVMLKQMIQEKDRAIQKLYFDTQAINQETL